MQEFTAPLATNYRIQCWGASGGNSYRGLNAYGQPTEYTSTVYGGKGGYCSGWITYPNSLSIYIYVGQSGEGTQNRTFNGGGAGGSLYNAFSGGGATDVRLTNGVWDNFESLKSRIIIAAGGGGAQHWREGSNGGNAGGLSGQNGFCSYSPNYSPCSLATGATQTSGGEGAKSTNNQSGFNGTLGNGGDSYSKDGSGGGGGYYGGGGGGANSAITCSGAGGSSFISGYPGCNAISSSSTGNNIIHTGQSNHYSGKVFTNPVMIDGGSIMPKPKGGNETGHSGDGYCIISWISPNL